MTIHFKAVEQYFPVELFFNFIQFEFLENLSVLDLALSGVKGLDDSYKRSVVFVGFLVVLIETCTYTPFFYI